MKTLAIGTHALLVFAWLGLAGPHGLAAVEPQTSQKPAASAEGRPRGTDGPQPSPFHGYYFKLLTAQGPAAAGRAKDYVVDGRMSGGFALVAWPAQYDVTGVMTLVVNQDGIVREKDLGPETDGAARTMTLYNPDGSWGSGQ